MTLKAIKEKFISKQKPSGAQFLTYKFGYTFDNPSYEYMAIVRRLTEIDHGKFENNYKEVIQLWESISPNPALREHKLKYLWLNEIYEIYLEEFKRISFDADIYAVKTRKLIHESAKLINFKGHLPEIIIDSDYLNKLKDTKLDPSDKAEKIIRDIETVIRQNEVNSAIYVEFQNRLDQLIKQKQEQSLAIEEILLQLSSLYTELDDVASLPHRMVVVPANALTTETSGFSPGAISM